ncbi:uncharacterized protein K02A2.6-like [Lineus longissimus]|uniref:uncharacterized protein K02A2.6-like n=1 Tax=Lineus longissimus TaxID=88925 RepID=UPI00315DA79C
MGKEQIPNLPVRSAKVRIVTAHKPLLPLFNKATAKLPPRIERWVMDMQDVEFELEYQPGKDEQDPLDFLSRHPLPTTGNDNTEKTVKYTITAQHAVVIDRIKEETRKDSQLQKLKDVIRTSSWDKYRQDPMLQPFYHVRDELFEAEDLIFKSDQIVMPTSLQRKIVNTAHSMGHLGMTKTKQMLRAKYWFPHMNAITEQIIGQCMERQVTTKSHRQEPVKMTEIPKKPWEAVATDFGGPYPDGHYNLVVIDKRSRYPEAEKVASTSAKPTIEKLRKMFATHGVPRQLDSDNGPPFTSEAFRQFAEEEGFDHHKVTPLHARANGEAESFMKMLNKIEQICHLQNLSGADREQAIQNMLVAYRSTPHPGIGVSPYQAMMNRDVRTKLDYIEPVQPEDDPIAETDRAYKEKIQQQSARHRLIEYNAIPDADTDGREEMLREMNDSSPDSANSSPNAGENLHDVESNADTNDSSGTEHETRQPTTSHRSATTSQSSGAENVNQQPTNTTDRRSATPRKLPARER